ncbi:MAG: PilZ domain-containing protein [Candidatus Abyssobacteria bacterium SURF_17]|jgi:hypothetical protein|uniref:PilZ domain-containing protein n=1 Tax=Candidatus Abyssobacteria bacterium SURF_17 TaxID=2093361 RepID=A0A419F259_9BACT|nr:MAG: PilZ domain-containing protein [Candidatus Abyssubacteria bacterium SURF_17]
MTGVEMKEMQREERRAFTRHDCSRFACSCVVKPHVSAGNGPKDDKFGAVVLDVCCDGLCLETNLEASPGTRLFLEIRPIVGPGIATWVNVLHSRPSATGGFHIIGSQFTDLDEHDRQNLLTLLRTIAHLEEDLTAC